MKNELNELVGQFAAFRESTLDALGRFDIEFRRLRDLAEDPDTDPDAGTPSLRLPSSDAPAQSSSGPRLHQMKTAMTLAERLRIDAVANAMSEACGSRISTTNLIRGAVIVLQQCESEIIDQIRSIQIRRPHNHDLTALGAFEMEIARLIARAASNCRLP